MNGELLPLVTYEHVNNPKSQAQIETLGSEPNHILGKEKSLFEGNYKE